MPFSPPVERWRDTASQVAPPLPPSFVLAVLARESRGVPGVVSKADARGLMQTKIGVLEGYNKAFPEDPISESDLTGTSAKAAQNQIQLGAWYLDGMARKLHQVDPARFPYPLQPITDDQILFSALGYVAGWGGLQGLLKEAGKAGVPFRFEDLEKYKPGWGLPDKRWAYARYVLKATREDQGIAPESIPVPFPPSRPQVSTAGGSGIAGVFVLVLVWSFVFGHNRGPS